MSREKPARLSTWNFIALISTAAGALAYEYPEGPRIQIFEPLPDAIYRINVFKVSRVSSRSIVDSWLIDETGIPASNPVKFSTLFSAFFGDSIEPDENGDICMGYPNKAEICLQESFCSTGSVGIKAKWAGEYVVDFMRVTHVPKGCNLTSDLILSGDHILPREIVSAFNQTILVKYADEVSAWWGKAHGVVEACESWKEMMTRAFSLATPGGQVLEFGVATGRSITHLAELVESDRSWRNTTVLGFDSFKGLPKAWGRYGPALFDMSGIPPADVYKYAHIELKLGWFNETLPLVPRDKPISLLHIDSDLYESASEVLEAVSCLLKTGSIVVFDELFNLQGTYGEDAVAWWRTGEYRAWTEAAAKFGISWEPLGFYFEQAVPLRVTSTSTRSDGECRVINDRMQSQRERSEWTEAENARRGMLGLADRYGASLTQFDVQTQLRAIV